MISERLESDFEPETGEYLHVPSAADLADEALDDPTFPTEPPGEGTPSLLGSPVPPGSPVPARRRRGPALSPDQQFQVAVWIVEGYSYADAVKFMERDWHFSVSLRAWQYYRNVRTDLLDKAAKFVGDQYLRFGYSSRAIRFHKLAQHADRLERIMRQRGLYSTDTKVLGYGKNAEVVTAEVFEGKLSQEYRATIADMDKLMTPVEQTLKQHAATMQVTLDGDHAARFAQAAQVQLVGSHDGSDD